MRPYGKPDHKITVYIPIFSDVVRDKKFSLNGHNPGCGGTQFTSIRLAFFLATRYPDLNIILANHFMISVENPPSNLQQLHISDINELFVGLDDGEKRDNIVVLSTIGPLIKANDTLLRHNCDRIVVWLRHPFLFEPRIVWLKCAAYVCVGAYQYYSNHVFYSPLWYIQNLFVTLNSFNSIAHQPVKCPAPNRQANQMSYLEEKNEKIKHDETIRLVFLGALVRGKGFLHVAKQWSTIKNVSPKAELHVIGSSTTYAKRATHEVLPCDVDFGDEILNVIPRSDIEKGRVVFYGNLGVEKTNILKMCHVAVLNPTGLTEAFPASPIECMSLGLPVIASDKYGMADSMRFFPELAIRTPGEIPGKLSWVFDDVLRYQELQQRAYTVAKWFESQSEVILIRWYRLFQKIVERKVIVNEGPGVKLHGSRFRLYMRQLRVMMKVLKKRLVN